MTAGLGRRAVLAAGATFAMAAGPRPVLAATPIDRLELKWWRARHQAVQERLRAGAVELVFLGDSITQNWERSGPPSWADFRPVWDRSYGDRHALNLGFVGDTTANLLWRVENGEVAGIAPRAAVILIGANNFGHVHWSAEDTVLGIAAVLEATRRRLPQTRLLLLSILPSGRGEWVEEQTTRANASLARRYGSGSDPQQLAYADVARLFLRDGRLDRDLFYDPLETPPRPALHPTAAGQALIAAAIEPTLAAMLGEPPRA